MSRPSSSPTQVTDQTSQNLSPGWKGQCETLDQLAACLRTYTSEADKDAPNVGCSMNSRELAHRNGRCYSKRNGENPIFVLLGHADITSLEGRLLTIIDAAFHDPRQCKAVKDLVRNAIWFDWIPDLDTDGPSGGIPELKKR